MADHSNSPPSTTPEPRSETVRRIRHGFGITQTQLAKAMGTSAKAIQSYEQGWRKVPTRVLIQMFVLLAIHRRRQLDPAPCWEIRNCPPEVRATCPSHTVGDGQFCWFVSAGAGAATPEPAATDGEDRLIPCMDCEVIRRLLRDTPPEVAAAPGPLAPAVCPNTSAPAPDASVPPAATRGTRKKQHLPHDGEPTGGRSSR